MFIREHEIVRYDAKWRDAYPLQGQSLKWLSVWRRRPKQSKSAKWSESSLWTCTMTMMWISLIILLVTEVFNKRERKKRKELLVLQPPSYKTIILEWYRFRRGNFYSDISSLARHMFWNLCRPFLIIPTGNSDHKCFPQCESQSWWIWTKTPYNVVNCYFRE